VGDVLVVTGSGADTATAGCAPVVTTVGGAGGDAGAGAGAEPPATCAAGGLEATGRFAGTRFTFRRWMTTGLALLAAALAATVGSLLLLSAIPAPANPPIARVVVIAATFIRVAFFTPRSSAAARKPR
jgi:hypothetical protein